MKFPFLLILLILLASPLAAAPRALPSGAHTEDWPRFLGARDNATSAETQLLASFPEKGLTPLWAFAKGEGYASPAIVGNRLYLFHRVGEKEVLHCLDAETGGAIWEESYAAEYRDDFGYSTGPRAGPVVSQDRVITFGVASHLTCRDAKTGRQLWQHDCAKEYGVPQYFFGSGASPLVFGGMVVAHLGGSEERSVCAFDLETGVLKWTTKQEWGQSYASPILAKLEGATRLIVFAGGKSDPPTGGVLSIDPQTGVLGAAFPWRARRYPSVNASTPVACADLGIFISQSYIDRESPCNGSALLRLEKGQWAPVWKNEALACHWTTPVFHEGHLYTFSGEKEKTCQLVCHEAATGVQKWKQQFNWEYAAGGQTLPMGLYRGSLLRVDGRFLAMGEWGTVCWLDLSPAGARLLSKFQPFVATQSWTLPAISRGLLYVTQNEADKMDAAPTRLHCFDLRAH